MTNEIDTSTALKLGINILNKWKCTNTQIATILGFCDDTFQNFYGDAKCPTLTTEQLERLSYIVNIHAALNTRFSNSENVYGFMSMENRNEFFNGRTPLSVIYEESSSIHSLRAVCRRIEGMSDR
ncbi:hypothetical protein [Paraglaciecola chathamensis]|jgi:hypothetical protein|uniref:Antitoxin Xre/MbcA/ParS-like toxin-binding domain-containing protein n=2 Tax=Paraglaciecola chathamensis TaxID=368405 RepID=A0A8H9I650_9ALTE|nr:hypothetical protein [Paraglaciecola oceanifecundans]AEE24511.1 hypothetical protein Glaag_3581 [Glaciecola sp. 4H-3-7+YE-5]GAC07880.1 hypothetical protein GAGA_5058 [Paraglaciecola agarilytica NO2]GGZ48562.1 hypothetical protein GCM10011274_03060 [Paraglaciecola oceanifecundans]